MAVPNNVRFLATDIWDTPEDGKRYEVIDGGLYVTPPPVTRHQVASFELSWRIRTYLEAHPIGRMLPAPIGVVLDDENGLQPDLVFVSREREAIIGERGIDGAPDLIVEVLSPSTRSRDRGIKMRRYAAAGVPHYWMLDPSPRALEAYKLGENGYELLGTFGVGEILRPELFPGLEIPIDRLWA